MVNVHGGGDDMKAFVTLCSNKYGRLKLSFLFFIPIYQRPTIKKTVKAREYFSTFDEMQVLYKK